MKIDIEKIIVNAKIIDQKKMRAIISLDFGDFVIKGFRVMESNYENIKGDRLWVVVPSYVAVGGKYHPMFFMPNKDLWKELELRIWNEYYIQRDKYYKKQYGLENTDLINSP